MKSIAKKTEEESDDPYLIAIADRARAIQERYEDRQTTTTEALGDLFETIEKNEARKQEQAAKGFDGVTYYVYQTLKDAGLGNEEGVSEEIKAAFVKHPNWRQRRCPS